MTLGPSESVTIDYVEDHPGGWLYRCHVTDHLAGAMMGRLTVHP